MTTRTCRINCDQRCIVMAKDPTKVKGELTLVLLGSQGSGKSSTGNSIVGEKVFKAMMATRPVTIGIQKETILRSGLTLNVVDTPPLLDAKGFQHITQQLTSNEKSNAVFAIVIAIGRYTQDERIILEETMKRNKNLKNAIVIFTHRNELYDDDDSLNPKTIDDWIELNPNLSKMLKCYGMKYIVFENKDIDQMGRDSQFRDLLQLLGSDVGRATSVYHGDEDRSANQKITVDKATLENEFGASGRHFFDRQISKKN